MAELIKQIDDNEIQILGTLTKDSVPAVLQASKQYLAQCTRLTIDLSQVERADSAGVALLFEWLAMAHRRQVVVEFTHLPSQMLEIARASEMDSLIPLK